MFDITGKPHGQPGVKDHRRREKAGDRSGCEPVCTTRIPFDDRGGGVVTTKGGCLLARFELDPAAQVPQWTETTLAGEVREARLIDLGLRC